MTFKTSRGDARALRFVHRRQWATAPLAVLAMAIPACAHAQSNTDVSLSAGALADDNVYLLPPGQTSPGAICRRDHAGFAQGQAKITFGDTAIQGAAIQQDAGADRSHAFGDANLQGTAIPVNWTGQLSGSAQHTIYGCNTPLNNTAGQAVLVLASPALGPVNFALHSSLTHQLSPFSETIALNAQTLTRIGGRAEFRITPDIRFLLDTDTLLSRNQSEYYRLQNYNQTKIGSGFGYFSPIGNYAAIIVSKTLIKGKFANFATVGGSQFDLKSDYRDIGVSLQFSYAPSVIAKFSGNITHLSRKDRRILPPSLLYTSYNYKGLVGFFDFTYTPNPKTSVKILASRDLSSQYSVFVSGAQTDIASISIVETILADIHVHGGAAFVKQKLPVNQLFGFGAIGTTHQFNAQLGISKNITPKISMSLDLTHQARLSGGEFAPFAENSLRMQLTYAFGGGQQAQ